MKNQKYAGGSSQKSSGMDRRDFLKLTSFAALAAMTGGCEMDTATGGMPNIILILADDVGISNIGCYGGAYPTPNIDALASKGVRFEYCYATPVCSPSRAELLTGRYPFRTGTIDNNCRMNPANETMIFSVMKSAGYKTASVGKWHLSFSPAEWGADEYFVFPGLARYWGGESGWGYGYTQNGESKTLPKGSYFPDLMHDFVVDFMNRNKGNPFFVYYPMSHIHSPLPETPNSRAGLGTGNRYADNITYMDKLVGKLVDEVDSLGLANNTLIIFTGDNGQLGAGTINGRRIFGGKRGMTEGGTRVPFIASWPGVTPAGKVNSSLTDFSDFLPTFADLAGADLPSQIIDGQSVAGQLRGSSGGSRQNAYVECGGEFFARNKGFKLTGHGQLFDMSNAPYNEIPTENPEARASLQAFLDKLRGIPSGRGKGAG